MKIEVTMPNFRQFLVADDEPLAIEREGKQLEVYPVRLQPGDKIVVRSTSLVGQPLAVKGKP